LLNASLHVLREKDQSLIGAADGRDQFSAALELPDQLFRNFGRSGRQDDPVEGRLVGPSRITIAGLHHNVRISKMKEPLGRAERKLRHQFDAVHLAHEQRQHGGLIAGSGSDFKDGLVALQIEQPGHERDDVGLRNGLAESDRKRLVAVSEFRDRCRHEQMPRHGAHCLEYSGVVHVARFNLIHHTVAFMLGCVLRRARYDRCDQ